MFEFWKWTTVSPWATLPLGPKISQKQCCSSYVLKISVVQGIISVAQEILQKTVKSALLKVNTELFKNRVVSRTALLEVVLLKDLLYILSCSSQEIKGNIKVFKNSFLNGPGSCLYFINCLIVNSFFCHFDQLNCLTSELIKDKFVWIHLLLYWKSLNKQNTTIRKISEFV